MKNSKVFITELKVYKTAAHSSPNENNHTHDFLIESMEHHISDSREAKNREQRRDAMKAKVNAAAGPSAAATTVGGGPKNRNKNDSNALASVVEKLTNVCSTLASGQHVPETDYLATVAAFATVQKIKNPMELRPFDQTKVKGEKVCVCVSNI